MDENEKFYIIPVNYVTVSEGSSSRMLCLRGFNTLTKQCMHEYGLFSDLEEVLEFARLHSIRVEQNF